MIIKGCEAQIEESFMRIVLKKLLFMIIPAMLIFVADASAEYIYVSDAVGYSEKLCRAYGEGEAALMSENENNERTLLIYGDKIGDTFGAEYDISDDYSIHTLVYGSVAEARDAYEKFSDIGMTACIDHTFNVCSQSTISWGTPYIGSDRLISALAESEDMPEINVFVLDTGIDYEHPLLKERVSGGYDFVNRDNNAMDDNDHGTHVAGIIAANTLENVKITSVKVAARNGSMTLTDFKAGFSYAVENGADIINMSLCDDISDTERRILAPLFAKAHSDGIVLCASAGNASVNGIRHNADALFPACMDNVIVSANSDSFGRISATSNYGTVVDIAAPGTDIASAARGGGYITMTGTSMSCPFVSSACALLLTREPQLTPEEIEDKIKSSAFPFKEGAQGEHEGLCGAGILNLRGFIGENSNIPQLVYGEKSGKGTIELNISGITESDTIAAAGFRSGRLIKLARILSSETYTKCELTLSEDYDAVQIFVMKGYGMEPLSETFIILD